MKSTFNLSDWPVKVKIPDEYNDQWYLKTWPNYSDWCNKTFGANNWEYYYGRFMFKNEKDALLFKLKWL